MPEIVPHNQIPKACFADQSLTELYKSFSILEVLCKLRKGVGLHAVQVGQPWDMYVVRKSEKMPFGYYLNCKYTPLEEEKVSSLEGCLSLASSDGSSRFFKVNRFKKIRVEGQQLYVDGNKIKIDPVDMSLSVEEDGVLCVAHQHEIDHGRGVLISDIGEEQHIWM
jgi:peptide deformylase